MVVEEELKNMEADQHNTTTIATMVPITDLSHVIKRKRTKRQRPHYSSSEGNGYCQNKNDIRENVVNSATTTDEDISPVTTPTAPTTITTDEEEVDTAKCLLLLAQGNSHHKRKHDEDFGTTPYKYKFSSKIYLATPTENGKAGIYVYECKTCNRKFPSFQALGGHRASHRKPKAVVVDERKKLMYSDDEDIQQQPPTIKRSFSTSSLTLHNNNNNNVNPKSSPNKVHECGICGAEFMSGQALGGHMRRHRGAPPLTTTNTTLCLGPFSSTSAMAMDQINEKDAKKTKGNMVNLSLDLNLPATPEDHEHHHKFSYQQQQQKQKQSPLVLSAAPTLVDCHY